MGIHVFQLGRAREDRHQQGQPKPHGHEVTHGAIACERDGRSMVHLDIIIWMPGVVWLYQQVGIVLSSHSLWKKQNIRVLEAFVGSRRDFNQSGVAADWWRQARLGRAHGRRYEEKQKGRFHDKEIET